MGQAKAKSCGALGPGPGPAQMGSVAPFELKLGGIESKSLQEFNGNTLDTISVPKKFKSAQCFVRR